MASASSAAMPRGAPTLPLVVLAVSAVTHALATVAAVASCGRASGRVEAEKH